MKIFEIKISGSGTKEEIIEALVELSYSVDIASPEELSAGKTFEDETLCAEISEKE